MNPMLTPAAAPTPGLHHFVFGTWLLLLVCGVAAVGCVVGLACTRRAAQAADERGRRQWLAMAALSIGGVAVWLMHFVAILGFAVDGTTIRFDPVLTAVSLALPVGGSYAALLAAARRPGSQRLTAAGALLGLAGAAMHYTGMLAVDLQGRVLYDPPLAVLSAVVAVAGAAVALRLALKGSSARERFAGALLLAAAFVAMHYVGMAAVRVEATPGALMPAGLEAFSFLMPALVLGMLALSAPIVGIMLRGDAKTVDLNREADLLAAESAREDEARAAAARAAESVTAAV